MKPGVVSFRTDQAAADALEALTREGLTQTEALRQGVIRLAAEHRQQRLREQAQAVAADPDDLAEMRAIQQEMEPLRAW